jgi:DNA polymerase III subunit beta
MKLHCHKNSLMTAFQVVSGVIPSRTPKEILRNVKIEARDGSVTLSGTDQEIGIRYNLPGVEIEIPGETLLPTARMISILRELSDSSVDLELTDGGVQIRSGQSDFHLATEDPAEFPPIAEFEAENYLTISGNLLREAIRRTVFATDTESTRYALGGVLLELEADSFTLVATDSRRLAVMKSACKAVGEVALSESTPVIPSKAMTLIERSIENDDEDVLIAIQANNALVKSGHSTISCRLVEGRFPKYGDVIPDSSKVSVEFVVGTFLSAVKQAQIVTNDESRGVDFTFANGVLKLSSKAADIGQSTIELPIDYSADELTITFDPRFIAEFLRVLEAEKVVKLDLIDAESAAVFRTDDAYTYVTMPLSRDQ